MVPRGPKYMDIIMVFLSPISCFAPLSYGTGSGKGVRNFDREKMRIMYLYVMKAEPCQSSAAIG